MLYCVNNNTFDNGENKVENPIDDPVDTWPNINKKSFNIVFMHTAYILSYHIFVLGSPLWYIVTYKYSMATIPVPKIIRSRRSSISFQITPNGELIVKAPLYIPVFLIKQAVKAREEWILRGIEKLEKRKTQPKQYTNDEEFWYLGNKHKLNIGNYKVITLTSTLNFPQVLLFRIQKELATWYQRQAKEIITQRVMSHAEKMGASYKSIMFSDTKSKWGTCGPNNALQFNWRLVMVPLIIIDYVVIHELVHTTEKNHSYAFWRKVRAVTPACKHHRKWLNNHAHLLTF